MHFAFPRLGQADGEAVGTYREYRAFIQRFGLKRLPQHRQKLSFLLFSQRGLSGGPAADRGL